MVILCINDIRPFSRQASFWTNNIWYRNFAVYNFINIRSAVVVVSFLLTFTRCDVEEINLCHTLCHVYHSAVRVYTLILVHCLNWHHFVSNMRISILPCVISSVTLAYMVISCACAFSIQIQTVNVKHFVLVKRWYPNYKRTECPLVRDQEGRDWESMLVRLVVRNWRGG